MKKSAAGGWDRHIRWYLDHGCPVREGRLWAVYKPGRSKLSVVLFSGPAMPTIDDDVTDWVAYSGLFQVALSAGAVQKHRTMGVTIDHFTFPTPETAADFHQRAEASLRATVKDHGMVEVVSEMLLLTLEERERAAIVEAKRAIDKARTHLPNRVAMQFFTFTTGDEG